MRKFSMTESRKPDVYVSTADGRQVRIICWNADSVAPVIGLITQPCGGETLRSFYTSGVSSVHCDDEQLVMRPVLKEGWVNRRSTHPQNEKGVIVSLSGYVFETEEDARSHAGNNTRMHQMKINWEE